METSIRCPKCGDIVEISPSVCPGVINVRACQCCVKGVSTNTAREAAVVWNASMERLQRMYGRHVVPGDADKGTGVFRPVPAEVDRFGYQQTP